MRPAHLVDQPPRGGRMWCRRPLGPAACDRAGPRGRRVDISGSGGSVQPGRHQATGVPRMGLGRALGNQGRGHQRARHEDYRGVAQITVSAQGGSCRSGRLRGVNRCLHRFRRGNLLRAVGCMTWRAHLLGMIVRPRRPAVSSHESGRPSPQRDQDEQDTQHRRSQANTHHELDDRGSGPDADRHRVGNHSARRGVGPGYWRVLPPKPRMCREGRAKIWLRSPWCLHRSCKGYRVSIALAAGSIVKRRHPAHDPHAASRHRGHPPHDPDLRRTFTCSTLNPS
jgi:hypothetical protein